MGLETESEKLWGSDYFVDPIQKQDFISKYFSGQDYSDEIVKDVCLSKYLNEKAISEMIKVNSEISKILGAFKIPVRINLKILNNLIRNHLPRTRRVALGIAQNLAKEFQSCVNVKALSEATGLHDLAKVIIPEDIINKDSALNDSEREIMEKHASLSYELLKNTDLDEETLNLIKNHHEKEEGLENDINLQILSMADIYSALREKRSYKPAMSKETSLCIIREEVIKGKFSPEVYEALAKYSKQEDLPEFKFDWQVFNFKPVNSFGS